MAMCAADKTGHACMLMGRHLRGRPSTSGCPCLNQALPRPQLTMLQRQQHPLLLLLLSRQLM